VSGGGPYAEGVAGTVRIVGANAAAGLDRHTGVFDIESFAGAVAGLEADVVALQEIDHRLPRSGGVDQAAVVAAACAGDGPPWQHRFAAAIDGTPGDPRTFRSAATTLPGEPSYGVALLTRWDVEEWHELRLPPSRARLPVVLPPGAPQRVLWVPDEQRVAVAAVLATPSGTLSVVCTHLSFSPPRAVGQLRRIRAWSVALPRPLVLVGDLNLPGGLPAGLTRWQSLAQHATYPAHAPRVQLDHVLADGRVRVEADRAVRVAGSDHRALVVDLVLGPHD
jgi:endonuclease/exonuclease/phosphatase family metal-dependent hydrolase